MQDRESDERRAGAVERGRTTDWESDDPIPILPADDVVFDQSALTCCLCHRRETRWEHPNPKPTPITQLQISTAKTSITRTIGYSEESKFQTNLLLRYRLLCWIMQKGTLDTDCGRFFNYRLCNIERIKLFNFFIHFALLKFSVSLSCAFEAQEQIQLHKRNCGLNCVRLHFTIWTVYLFFFKKNLPFNLCCPFH